MLPKCSESVQGVRSILVQRCHHNIGPKQCSLSCNRVTANCHDAMICDVSCCANLRLLLIFWNLWRLLLQWLMYLKHQACDHCDSLFNDFNVCFCVFAYGKTWESPWKVHDPIYPIWSCQASWLRRAPSPWVAHEGLGKKCRSVQPSKSK